MGSGMVWVVRDRCRGLWGVACVGGIVWVVRDRCRGLWGVAWCG